MLKKISEIFNLYIVGGACRDEVLGLNPTDIDYCCEATEDEFEKHFPFLKKVGRDFPVYLNTNGEEIALTRTEKCTGKTYQSFEFVSGVSIEDDLSRRDVTFNSIAKCFKTNKVIDPFNGINDLQEKIIRCINKDAFQEDPLRILRICRFAGRFYLVIEKQTKKLMKENVKEIKNITKERITLELEKSYKQLDYPSDFIRTLNSIEALVGPFEIFAKMNERFAGPDKYHGRNTILDHILESYDLAKQNDYNFSVGIACLFHDIGKTQTPNEIYNPKRQHIGHDFRGGDIVADILSKFRFDRYTNILCEKSVKFHMKFHDIKRMKTTTLIKLYNEIGSLYFDDVVKVANCDHPFDSEKFDIIERIKKTFATKVVLPEGLKDGKKIKQFVEQFRVKTYNELKKGK